MNTQIAELETPYLVLDVERARQNIDRLHSKLQPFRIEFRPHLKTAKSLDVARMLSPNGPGPIAVSTLREADAFAAAGFTDILDTVGIAPSKLDHVVALHRAGAELIVLLDSREQARAVADAAQRSGQRIPALIEFDCDGHRGGLLLDDPAAVEIAQILESGGAEARGVLVHAGESYFAGTEAALIAAAENERDVAARAAQQLRDAGFAAPAVSLGSTPTAHFATNLDGVTEVRAGNFVFFDLVMAGMGVCQISDLAISVVTTVIGHRREKGWIMIDAGWMAMSQDRGTAKQPVDQGYGLITTIDGEIIPDLLMVSASQEHGMLAMRPGNSGALPDIPVGTQLRVLPNHACATAAQHNSYRIVHSHGADTDGAIWPRVNGW